MPFSGNTYTNVSGATTALPGQTVQSATWDNIHTDYATALTQLMSQLTSQITNRNIMWMNGGFEVWQRGAGNSANIPVAASNTLYTADRWYLATSANEAHTVSAVTGLTNNSQLAGQVQRTAAQTGTSQIVFGYPLDLDEIIKLRGNKVSLNVTLKAGANWSPASGTISISFACGTAAVTKLVNGYTNQTNPINTSTNLTPGGSAVTLSFSSSVVVPTTTTQAEVLFLWTPVGTAGANDFVQIDDVQLESQLSTATWTPTNFDRIPFYEMLQGCQRFFCKSFNYSVHATVSASYANSIQLMAQVANVSLGQYVQFPVRLRTTASVTLFNPTNNNNTFQNLDTNVSVTPAIDPHTTVGDVIIYISGVSVSAVGQTIAVHYTASAGI